jgi:hypothetical protein
MASSKTTHTSRADDATGSIDAAQYQQAAQQGTRQQMTAAVESTSLLLRGAEVWSELQLHAVQRSAKTWREAAQLMRAAKSPMDLVGVQNHLLMNSMLQAFQLTQELMQSSLAMQQGGVLERAQEAADDAAGAAAPMAMMQAPIMQAWQSMMNPMGLNGASGAAAR